MKKKRKDKASTRRKLSKLLKIYSVCVWCGLPFNERIENDPLAPSLEHIIDGSRGGTDDIANLAVAHRHCNTLRSAGRLPMALIANGLKQHRKMVALRQSMEQTEGVA